MESINYKHLTVFNTCPAASIIISAKIVWDIVPEEKTVGFFSSSEWRKCSKCGVHKGIYVYKCRFTKVN